ncbi:MAG: MBOAT family protein, partial [Solobacterium sp.]|nr:MBOAT family protein [Solobacterium sp.]
MVFSSLTFLFAYLPIVLTIYFLVPIRWRNLVLLLVSLFFYGWGEPVYVLVMIASIIINWLFGKAISATRDTAREKSKRYLILCMVFNLALLIFFKYFDFLAENLRALGITALRPLHLGLPIGISFYTFQTMSYPIDLYRHDTDPQKSLISFGAYVCMFPQLIAGPIVRYTDIAKQLNERTITTDGFYKGIQ